MTPTSEIARVNAPRAAARPPKALARADAPSLARQFAQKLSHRWLPRASWTVSRTGRPGLVGIALLLASALFLFSTHLRVAGEVEGMRAELAAAQGRVYAPAAIKVGEPSAAMRELPARTDMPSILRQLFSKAAQAKLAVDTAKYEITATKNSDVVRYQISFPVTGPYPQIRAFLDQTLSTMPEVALSDLVLERKSIADGNVEAQIRMTMFARSSP